MIDTPAAHGFAVPAEWHPRASTWIAWPGHPELWGTALEDVRAEVAQLVSELTWAPPGAEPEPLDVLVRNDETEASAARSLSDLPVRLHRQAYGEIWVRDTLPWFLRGPDGALGAVCFRHDGWGGKYDLPGDRDLAPRVAALAGARTWHVDWVLEGGAVELDGEGTAITTRQCLLNPNRNGGPTEAEVEEMLGRWLGVRTVIWLDDGLLEDHTDGHVDTLARFVRPGIVACMMPSPGDPNAAALDPIDEALSGAVDARGRRLKVIRVPSPGAVHDPADGRLLPASHVNWYVGRHVVVVPTYGTPSAEAAVAAVATCFPHRRVVGTSARALLLGGGAFHCITQQVPAPLEDR